MMQETGNHKFKNIIAMSIVLIVLGVSFSTTLSDRMGPIGLVFIVLGAVFLVIGMRKKNQ